MLQNTMTVAEFKANFSQVLGAVQNGAEYKVLFGRTKRPVAKLCPIQQEKRRIGILDGLATFTEVGDGKISVEEFLGL